MQRKSRDRNVRIFEFMIRNEKKIRAAVEEVRAGKGSHTGGTLPGALIFPIRRRGKPYETSRKFLLLISKAAGGSNGRNAGFTSLMPSAPGAARIRFRRKSCAGDTQGKTTSPPATRCSYLPGGITIFCSSSVLTPSSARRSCKSSGFFSGAEKIKFSLSQR